MRTGYVSQAYDAGVESALQVTRFIYWIGGTPAGCKVMATLARRVEIHFFRKGSRY